MESDIHPLSRVNIRSMFKYADDASLLVFANLLVPESTDIPISDEYFSHSTLG